MTRTEDMNLNNKYLFKRIKDNFIDQKVCFFKKNIYIIVCLVDDQNNFKNTN